MPDEPSAPNTLTPGVRNRSTAQGDVPERLQRRYYVDGRGGAGLGFYADATVKAPAFRDEGRRLAAARSDPNAIRDMTAIAQHRGWAIVVVRGSNSFRREAWLAGRTVGLEVRGYRPTERDIQELDRRIDRRNAARARSDRTRDQPEERSPPEAQDGRHLRRGGGDQLKIVEAVVRARVADPAAQERIVAGARNRIAEWLERGARFERLDRPHPARADPARERRR